jgi:hypothetical protein
MRLYELFENYTSQDIIDGINRKITNKLGQRYPQYAGVSPQGMVNSVKGLIGQKDPASGENHNLDTAISAELHKFRRGSQGQQPTAKPKPTPTGTQSTPQQSKTPDKPKPQKQPKPPDVNIKVPKAIAEPFKKYISDPYKQGTAIANKILK